MIIFILSIYKRVVYELKSIGIMVMINHAHGNQEIKFKKYATFPSSSYLMTKTFISLSIV